MNKIVSFFLPPPPNPKNVPTALITPFRWGLVGYEIVPMESSCVSYVFIRMLRPGLTARTLLECSLNGRKRGPNFDTAHKNGEKIENKGVALAVHR